MTTAGDVPPLLGIDIGGVISVIRRGAKKAEAAGQGSAAKRALTRRKEGRTAVSVVLLEKEKRSGFMFEDGHHLRSPVAADPSR